MIMNLLKLEYELRGERFEKNKYIKPTKNTEYLKTCDIL